MNKKLLTAVLLTVALAGCGTYIDRVELFPEEQADLFTKCDVNGGIKEASAISSDVYYYKSAQVQTLRTSYTVKCNNGATFTEVFSRPAQ